MMCINHLLRPPLSMVLEMAALPFHEHGYFCNQKISVSGLAVSDLSMPSIKMIAKVILETLTRFTKCYQFRFSGIDTVTPRMVLHIHGWMQGGTRFDCRHNFTPPRQNTESVETSNTQSGGYFQNYFKSRSVILKWLKIVLARLAKPDLKASQVARRLNLDTLPTYYPKKQTIKPFYRMNRLFYVQPRNRNQHDRNIHYAQLHTKVSGLVYFLTFVLCNSQQDCSVL